MIRKYEELLLNVTDEEMRDALGDLLIVEALRKKIRNIKDQPRA